MTHLFKYAVSLLIGLTLAALGLAHAVGGYPGPDVFARLAADLPAIGAVSVFALAVTAVVAGVALLAVSARRLRPGRRPAPASSPRRRRSRPAAGPTGATATATTPTTTTPATRRPTTTPAATRTPTSGAGLAPTADTRGAAASARPGSRSNPTARREAPRSCWSGARPTRSPSTGASAQPPDGRRSPVSPRC